MRCAICGPRPPFRLGAHCATPLLISARPLASSARSIAIQLMWSRFHQACVTAWCAAGVPPESYFSHSKRFGPGAFLSRSSTGRSSGSASGVNGQFVCTYFGTMGEANDLTPVVEAARLLEGAWRERHRVFVLHGKGKQSRRPSKHSAAPTSLQT